MLFVARYNRMVLPLTEEEVRKTGVAEIRKKYNEFAKYYMRIYNRELLYCAACDDFHAAYAFYEDRRYPSGYFPECKESLKKQAMDYDKKTDTYKDNKKKTIEVFRKLDIPFIESTYDASLRRYEEGGSLGGNPARAKSPAYINTLTTIKSLQQYDGKTFKDSQMMNDNVFEAEDNRTARDDIKRVFGDGLTESDYLYLQDQYDDWYARTQVDSISQQTLIVQICFVQLNLWKAQKAGKDTKDLIRSLNDLMAAANLQPKQNVNNAAGDDLSYGQWIEKIETTRPISEPSPEFQDVDGIKKYITVWFLGHLCYALGIHNFYSQAYEEEIKKYTVERPTEDDTGSTQELRQKIFGKDGE